MDKAPVVKMTVHEAMTLRGILLDNHGLLEEEVPGYAGTFVFRHDALEFRADTNWKEVAEEISRLCSHCAELWEEDEAPGLVEMARSLISLNHKITRAVQSSGSASTSDRRGKHDEAATVEGQNDCKV